MAVQIQLRRGAKANLPSTAALAEPLVTSDTHELYLGTGTSVIPLKVDWNNLLNAPAGAVDSVNGQTGAVVLDTDDIGEGSSNLYFTNGRADARITAARGAANGICPLDAGSKVPDTNLPIIDGGSFT